MINIPLTRGKVATIDEVDQDLVNFKWRAHPGTNGIFYAVREVKVGGKRIHIWMHQIVLIRLLHLNLWPIGLETDHKDRDGLNNRRGNLVLVTHSQNQQNAGLSKANTSGVRGVSWNNERQKWFAYIRVDHHLIGLGSYKNFEDAVQARKLGEEKYWCL